MKIKLGILSQIMFGIRIEQLPQLNLVFEINVLIFRMRIKLKTNCLICTKQIESGKYCLSCVSEYGYADDD